MLYVRDTHGSARRHGACPSPRGGHKGRATCNPWPSPALFTQAEKRLDLVPHQCRQRCAPQCREKKVTLTSVRASGAPVHGVICASCAY